MSRRIAFLAAVLTSTLSAQFSGLSSTADGSSVYFASTLRLKGSSQPRNGKVFLATQDGVSLFRAREPAFPPADSPACTVGGFADYLGAETSAAGVVALSYRATSSGGGCSYPVNPFMTQIVTASGDTTLPGIVRLSTAGRYAIVYLGATARPSDSFRLSFLDLQTGAQTPINVPAPTSPEYVSLPYSGGRIIANDGTALLGITDIISSTRHGYILKPGADPAPFPIADGLPLIIDASASKVLYQKQNGLYLLDLRTLQSTPLVPADQFAFNLRMSDDARRLLFLRDGQVHVLDTATLLDRALTDDPAKVTEAAISGDGKIVHAVTGRGRLLKVNVDDGSQIELIGHTPYLDLFYGLVVPGLTLTLSGSGLSDSVINGTLPLNPWLGNVTMWIGERKVPVVQLTPTSVSVIVPWDIQSDGGLIRIQAEAPGDHTPFYFPEVIVSLYPDPAPRAGAILHQDWTQTYVGPINTGEIIHVYAIGFGPVSPEVSEGAAAPSAEPFSRITQSLTCSNAGIRYAGLAPGAVERVYQIDIRIGPTPGYQKFTCSLGGADPFLFLTLDIVP
ncbi:MAG TPA: hypothetical protein VFC57_08245 [Aeromicrobium sp.]|nr:hypothetical protein [Aeromicrobium sp.]